MKPGYYRRFLFLILLFAIVYAWTVHDRMRNDRVEREAPLVSPQTEGQDNLDSMVAVSVDEEMADESDLMPISKGKGDSTSSQEDSLVDLAPDPQNLDDGDVLVDVGLDESCETLRESTPFYADPKAQAIRIMKDLAIAGKEEEAQLLSYIACRPHPTWVFGDEFEQTFEDVRRKSMQAGQRGKIPVFILYNRASVDDLSWESGISNDEYQEWVRGIAEAIGDVRAWVVLEPDALGAALRYSEAQQTQRYQQFADSVQTLKNYAVNTRVYIDAGHSDWLSVDETVSMLTAAGVGDADGFSLNISNFQRTEDEVAYGNSIAELLGGKHFIVDTARNGNGPTEDSQWCNPRGRALGEPPMFVDDEPYLDAYHWLKPPGESDGTCNGGPQPGVFWLEYALELARNAEH